MEAHSPHVASPALEGFALRSMPLSVPRSQGLRLLLSRLSARTKRLAKSLCCFHSTTTLGTALALMATWGWPEQSVGQNSGQPVGQDPPGSNERTSDSPSPEELHRLVAELRDLRSQALAAQQSHAAALAAVDQQVEGLAQELVVRERDWDQVQAAQTDLAERRATLEQRHQQILDWQTTWEGAAAWSLVLVPTPWRTSCWVGQRLGGSWLWPWRWLAWGMPFVAGPTKL